jgi:hypothetical protein
MMVRNATMATDGRSGKPRRPGRTIGMDSVVVATEQQVSSQLGEETVILHMDDGIYYGMDPVGTSIWALLQQPRTVGEIRDRLLEEYDVEAEHCERDLVTLLRDLAERRLIEVSEPEVPGR